MHPAWVHAASKAVSDDPRRTMYRSRESPRLSITDHALVTPSGIAEMGPSSPIARVTFASDGSAEGGVALAEGRGCCGTPGTADPRRHTSDFPRRTPRHS